MPAHPSRIDTRDDALPSWNDGPLKRSILDFTARVTREGGSDFIPIPERIATFDNDGTLWCEKPAYVQLDFLLRRLHKQLEAHPELHARQPYKAIWEGDLSYFHGMSMAQVQHLAGTLIGFMAGTSQAELESDAREFFAQVTHPRFKTPYPRCVYQPMVELVRWLQANDFRVFICTAGGMDFVRLISEESYGIPRENVIGTQIALRYERDGEGPRLVREDALVQPVDEGPGKPVQIEYHIGRRPFVSVGNSDGDISMLGYAQDRARPFLSLLLHHDDAEREYAYDTGAEQALQEAQAGGWHVISMKRDWRTVFPPAPPRGPGGAH